MSRGSQNKHSASWWLVVLSGGLVVVFSFAIIREVIRTRQIRNQLSQLRSEISAEEKRHQQLKELIAYLGSPTFQEREARLQLGLKKSGERVILVPSGESTNSSSAIGGGSGNVTEADKGVPQRWWEYFFSRDLHKTDGSS